MFVVVRWCARGRWKWPDAAFGFAILIDGFGRIASLEAPEAVRTVRGLAPRSVVRPD